MQSRRNLFIIAGSVIASCLLCSGLFAFIRSIGTTNTPTPTLAEQEIIDNAMQTISWSFTQTAAALPTFTPSKTLAPLPTNTRLPTNTPLPAPTATQLPTATLVVIGPTSPEQSDCIAAYPNFCITDSPRIPCADLPKNFTVLPPDPLGYDRDNDGVGCEN